MNSPDNKGHKDHLILLTNDDGFFAEGIEILFNRLDDLGQIFIVAPDQEKSATSLSLTLHHPLRIKTIMDNVFAVSGTPADCIYLALQKILPRKPDLIFSGINHGPNLGQQDISYSGTVAGAIQGTFLQVPSVAVSLMPDKKGKFAFEFAAGFVHKLARHLLEKRLPQGITLNINIPPLPIKGIKLAKLGQKRYNPEIVVKKDPRNRTYYWIGTGRPKEVGEKNSDVFIFKEGYLTITPLHTDQTDYTTIKSSQLKSLLSWIENENI
ncbi:MAG: 5'/3'-nucleotidase SurE [Candidatus Aminicenantes bacterium]|jgi:5'-nucleotidase